jgi:pterin-4a-carbinolamine dehydratase
MSRLLEHIIKNSSMIDFNLTKSYNENKRLIERVNNPEFDMTSPIKPIKSDWEEIEHSSGVYLEKTYKFRDIKHIKYFLNECIDKSESLAYYPEIFVKHHDVKVYLKSEFTNQVSDEDISFSKFLNEVYEDIFYLNS